MCKSEGLDGRTPARSNLGQPAARADAAGLGSSHGRLLSVPLSRYPLAPGRRSRRTSRHALPSASPEAGPLLRKHCQGRPGGRNKGAGRRPRGLGARVGPLPPSPHPYSHSMVAGGLEVTS